MLTNGAQIKAARALVGWSQRNLAQASGLHENAVAYWEAKSSIKHHRLHTSSGTSRIIRALASVGVSFIAEPGPGACIVPPTQFPSALKSAATRPNRPSSAAIAA